MNHLKIRNYISAQEEAHSAEINTNIGSNRVGNVIVLSSDDVENPNLIYKLKGIKIDVLIIPKKFKYTFIDTGLFKELQPLMFNSVGRKLIKISYY